MLHTSSFQVLALFGSGLLRPQDCGSRIYEATEISTDAPPKLFKPVDSAPACIGELVVGEPFATPGCETFARANTPPNRTWRTMKLEAASLNLHIKFQTLNKP